MWVSMARARSALPFIGSPGKHLPTIAATSTDARHYGAPADAARRDGLPLLRSPQSRDNGRKHRAAARADPMLGFPREAPAYERALVNELFQSRQRHSATPMMFAG